MTKVEKNLAQLELLILLTIRRLNPSDRHLSKIVLELECKTSRWINVANVFTSLKSMTGKGYLISREEEQLRPGPGRKTKMIYNVTSLGNEVLNLAVRDVLSLAEGVELWGRVDNSIQQYEKLRSSSFRCSWEKLMPGISLRSLKNCSMKSAACSVFGAHLYGMADSL